MTEVTELQATEGTDRVRAHTASSIQAELDREMVERIAHLSNGSSPDGADRAIAQRLDELDKESDIERVLEFNAGVLSLSGMALGHFVNRRWYVLPAAVMAFLIQHAVQGWCPPVPVFRRFGVRTRQEIEAERHALKLLRGDAEMVRRSESDGEARAESALKAALA